MFIKPHHELLQDAHRIPGLGADVEINITLIRDHYDLMLTILLVIVKSLIAESPTRLSSASVASATEAI